MAVIQTKGGGGLLSMLGPVATLAGAVIPGAPGWLTAAGLGASALGSAMNGTLSGSLGQVLNGLLGIFTPMQNPGDTGGLTEEEQAKRRNAQWSPYANMGAGTW